MENDTEVRILDRIDQLIDATEKQTTTISSLEQRLGVVEESTKSLDQMLRGDPGTVGLVTDVAVMKATINQVRGELVPGTPTATKLAEGPTWKWLADNYTSVAIPIILWLLLTILPEIVNNIKSALP